MIRMCWSKFLRPYHIQELVLARCFILYLQWLSVVGAVIISTWQIHSLKDWKAIQLDQSRMPFTLKPRRQKKLCSGSSGSSAEVTPLMGRNRPHSMPDTMQCTVTQFNPISAWREDEVRLDPIPNSVDSLVSWSLVLCMGSMINMFAFPVFLSFFPQIVEN